MKINHYLISGILAFGLLGSSCKDTEKDKEKIDVDALDPSSSLNTSFEGKIFSIPSPLQTAMLIKASNVKFNEALMNSTDNLSKYSTEQKRALNLGIYGTDMGYAIVYEQNSLALKYLSTVEKLTNDLGLSGAFDKDFIKRFQDNSNNQDSMINVVTSAFRKSDNFLKTNKRENTSALILTGGWIESLFFACELYRTSNNPKILERIGEQKQTLSTIVEILKEYNKDKANDGLIGDMERLESDFKRVILEYTFVEPKTDAAKKLTTLKHSTSVKVDTDVFNIITNQVKSIRNRIIE
jgi:hypothetical protein